MSMIDRMDIRIAVDDRGYRTSLDRVARDYEGTTKRIEAAGQRMSLSLERIFENGIGFALANITLRLGMLPAAMLRAAGDFEATMGAISAASGATRGELDALGDSARELGLKYGVGAKEAAEATLELVKAGVSTKDAINGATEAAIIMARATGGTAADGATIAAKAMQSFGLQASDMSMIVQQAAGVINGTTFELQDYALALGQGGKVAASAGLSFRDFNAAIAAISPAFSSGSDAGTSFKTFLNALTPKTREAKTLMDQLGMSFYTAAGQMKPIEEIADQLRKALGGLSDAQKSAATEMIFGTDAMRAALALMDAGREGVVAMRDVTIAHADAQAMAAARTQGLNGQLQGLKAQADELAISIGETGLIRALTGLVGILQGVTQAAADAAKWMGTLNSQSREMAQRQWQGAIEKRARELNPDAFREQLLPPMYRSMTSTSERRKAEVARAKAREDARKAAIKEMGLDAPGAPFGPSVTVAGGSTSASGATTSGRPAVPSRTIDMSGSLGGAGGGKSSLFGLGGYDDPFKTFSLFGQDDAPKNLGFATDKAKELSAEAAKIINRTDEMKRGFDQAAESFGEGFADAILGAKSFGDALKNLAQDIARVLLKKTVVNPISNWLSAGLSSMFGGFFADGGSPPVGKVSVVGERGPELFVPKGAGTIIPNHALGGGVNVTYAPVIDARGADPSVVERIRRELRMDQATRVAQVTAIVREGMTRRRFRTA